MRDHKHRPSAIDFATLHSAVTEMPLFSRLKFSQVERMIGRIPGHVKFKSPHGI